MPSDTPTPKVPRSNVTVTQTSTNDSSSALLPSSKRKAETQEDVEMHSGGDEPKKAKAETIKISGPKILQSTVDGDSSRIHAQAAAVAQDVRRFGIEHTSSCAPDGRSPRRRRRLQTTELTAVVRSLGSHRTWYSIKDVS